MVIISSIILQQKGIYMYKNSLLALIFLFSLIFQGCSEKKSESSEVQEVNSMVSKNEYVLSSLKNEQYIITKEGEGFILEGAEGKVVILDIFATWCPPCRAAAEHLSRLQKKYKDDLVVIGLSVEDGITNTKLAEFQKEYSAEYVLVNSEANRRLISELATTLKLGERFPIPVMALYKDGKLINHYIGAIEEEFINSDIKRALGK